MTLAIGKLVGEIVGVSFERGISQYPNVNDEVHLVTEEDLARIYGSTDEGQVPIGRLASAEGIPVHVDLDKLVTRHCAILGSTGSGKSTTVASLLRSIAGGDTLKGVFPSARILLLDIHGEYARSLKSVSAVFRVSPNQGEQPLQIPFWALDPMELLSFLMGHVDEKAMSQVLERVCDYRTKAMERAILAGIDVRSMTVDTPVPFSLNKLWFELIDPEVKTWDDKDRKVPALLEQGDAVLLKAPKYKLHSTNNTAPYLNTVGVLGIRRPLEHLRSHLLDKQYDFLLHPGPWEPDLEGRVSKDIPDLLASWLGHEKPITVLDLSGIPSIVMGRLIGAILRIICDSLFWGREKSEGGVRRPVLIVMEEAHRYLSADRAGPAREMVQRVVKEGRKFGIGAMIVSQRPVEIDDTILSQCGTFVALRLSNAADRGKVQALLPDSLGGVIDSLPILRTGEAIVMGEAARLPIRCRITLPSKQFRPQSEDPEVSRYWAMPRLPESYTRVAASWRAQNPRWAETTLERTRIDEEGRDMERVEVDSSNLASVGHDSGSETLEVEFKNGSVYQYYNVPDALFSELMAASSKGAFFNTYIRNAFPYSRV
jgi:hypothetical protein